LFAALSRDEKISYHLINKQQAVSIITDLIQDSLFMADISSENESRACKGFHLLRNKLIGQ
jgi:hypothetical protein